MDKQEREDRKTAINEYLDILSLETLQKLEEVIEELTKVEQNLVR